MGVHGSSVASHRFLLVSLALAAVLCLNGFWWGWVEDWNPDQMALQMSGSPSIHMFQPGTFLKPPFHSYLNLFLSIIPLKAAEEILEAVTHSTLNFEIGILWWSRLIQVGLFLGTIVVSFRIIERSSGRTAARIVALIIATSSGFIVHTHFLTVDIPVTFWMLTAFLFAQSIGIKGRIRDYVFAGLLVGVATATKYNALVIGLAIPVFHCFENHSAKLHKIFFDVRLIVGVSMVPVGFFLANPYSLIMLRKFVEDFTYNYQIYPVYDGATSGTGYLVFISKIVEILGWPVALIGAAALAWTLARINQLSSKQLATTTAGLGVFIFYFLKFSATPRVEARFVLPVVPLILIATAPFFVDLGKRYRLARVGLLSIALAYSVIASLWVGYRFGQDPRMGAQAWVAAHLTRGNVIESGPDTPNWNKYPGIDVIDVRMPTLTGGKRLLSEVFAGDATMLKTIEKMESDKNIAWYDATALAVRRPDFIALDSRHYNPFLSGPTSRLYPEMREWIEGLLGGQLGYEVVYEASSPRSPDWLVPRNIQFLDNHIVILKRKIQ